jgi:hypothetical protein
MGGAFDLDFWGAIGRVCPFYNFDSTHFRGITGIRGTQEAAVVSFRHSAITFCAERIGTAVQSARPTKALPNPHRIGIPFAVARAPGEETAAGSQRRGTLGHPEAEKGQRIASGACPASETR